MDVLGAWPILGRVKVGGSGKVRGVPPLGSALELGSGKRRTGPPPVSGPRSTARCAHPYRYRIGAMIGAQSLKRRCTGRRDAHAGNGPDPELIRSSSGPQEFLLSGMRNRSCQTASRLRCASPRKPVRPLCSRNVRRGISTLVIEFEDTSAISQGLAYLT